METDFKEVLEGKASRKCIDGIVGRVIDSPGCFASLYALTAHEEEKIAWRAAWACEKLSIRMPELFLAPDLRGELAQRAMHCAHKGMRRLLLNTLLHLPAGEPIDVPLLNFCLERILVPCETPGEQAVCIKLAHALCRKEPELLNELRACLENMEPDFCPAAVQCARRHALNHLLPAAKERKKQTFVEQQAQKEPSCFQKNLKK